VKTILAKLATLLGVVPSRRYAALERRADDLRAEVKGWKKQAEKLTARAERAEAESKRNLELLKRARADVERLVQREAEFDQIQAQLTRTERALGVAREQLMAIEVKMDILEGAANVLDARTRATRHQPDKTTAAV
jgi:DNA repair exonuclease SbcCD ATPase subunit